MTSPPPSVETVFAFSAHPDPATAVGEVVGAVHDSRVMATTVLGLFAGSWPTGSRSLAWRTICRMLQPEIAVAGGLPEILHPRADMPATSDRSRHRSVAVIATDNGPAEVVADGFTAELASGRRPMVTFTGWDVELTGDGAGPAWDHTGPADGTRSTDRSIRRFLAVDSKAVGSATATVSFDPVDAAVMDFQGVRPLATDLSAHVRGREVTAINHRPGLEVINELTAAIDRPDLRPETLLIGLDDLWYRILAVDRVAGSLVLGAAPHRMRTDGSGSAMTISSTIAVAVPDLVDALIAVERRVGRGRRTLLAVSAQYRRQPNEVGSDHDVDDMAGRLDPLIIPSPGLLPGAVRSLVFGAPPVR